MEVNMQPTHDTPTPPVKAENPVVFWMKNQIAVTFLLDHKPAANGGPVPAKQPIINMVSLHKLEGFLRHPDNDPSPVGLRSLKLNEIPRMLGGQDPGDDSLGLNNPRAKYVFPASQGQQSMLTAFFQITAPVDPAIDLQEDHTIRVVNLINKMASTPEGILEISAPVVLKISAMPNWVGGGTDDVPHGCPITPPVPVDPTDVCATKPGYHPITLTRLSPEFASLQEANGAGVTVLVLDTLPPREDIDAALTRLNGSAPGANNLLRDMATDLKELNQLVLPLPPGPSSAEPPAINVFYQRLPDSLDEPNNPHQPRTGKDIDGDAVGFPMKDHGLSVAGIIRSIAPAANIVCARALNDYGAGDVLTLIALLEHIKDQLLMQRGNQDPQAFNRRLIINMSLVISPFDSQLGCPEMGPVSSSGVREGLKSALQALADLNVVIVAAAGNDSDPRMPNPAVTDMTCMPDPPQGGKHFGPRYPAAFASTIPQIIAVGAVDKTGLAAPYSNYPGEKGVATYGGSLLEKKNSSSGHTQLRRPIDALRVVYSASRYPALSRKDDPLQDQPPGDYPETNKRDDRAWAYWSGTSFAAPIITGLVACMLPAIPPTEARQRVIDLAGRKTIPWLLHDLDTDNDINEISPVISVQQC
jgi:subtilisin family serine protease